MNGIIFTLLLSIGLYSNASVAQNNQKQPAEKPSTDACPTWNNKSSVSKADYFMFLRKSPKAAKTTEIARYNQRNKDFNKPVYTSLVPQKATPSTEPEEEPQMEEPATETDLAQEKQEVPAVIPTIDVQTVQIKETQPVPPVIPDIKKEKTETTNSNIRTEKSEIDEKNKKGKHPFFSFHNKERKHWLRKLKFRKKGAAKCPDF